MPSTESKQKTNCDKVGLYALVGFGFGTVISATIYIGYKLWKSSLYDETYRRISAEKYASDDKINKMLHACATIIEMSRYGYLSTINCMNGNPCCRMIETRWKPQITIPFINIGSNKSSRKYKQIEMNNNVVITVGDIDGAGFVSLYGKLIEIKDIEKRKSMFPALWRLFLNGPNDPRFVMFTLYIQKIEFVSNRFNLDSTRNDWRPFILKRVETTLYSQVAEWTIDESPDSHII